MNQSFSWGKMHIMGEAVMLYSLTWMYAIYLVYTEYFLGVAFLVLGFISITAIFTNHYIEYERRVQELTEAALKAQKKRGRSRKKGPSGKEKKTRSPKEGRAGGKKGSTGESDAL